MNKRHINCAAYTDRFHVLVDFKAFGETICFIKTLKQHYNNIITTITKLKQHKNNIITTLKQHYNNIKTTLKQH